VRGIGREPRSPRRRMPGAVVFDLDGTLVNSVVDLAASLNLLLAEKGLPTHPLDAVRTMVGGGVRNLVARAWCAHGVPLDDEALDRLTQAFLAIYAPRATERTTLYPGAARLLADLNGAGVRLGLCTNKPTGISRKILRDLGVLEPFAAVVGGDCGLPRKPAGDMMRDILRQLGVPPDRSAMIGDSAADVGEARIAGVAVILVSYGYTAIPARELGPDAVIDGLAEAVRALLAIEERRRVGRAATGSERQIGR
jgi:phosphoglycolate phosphatase